MKAAAGGAERLRETWAQIAAPEGAGLAVACPRGSGRNGEILFRSSEPSGPDVAWAAVHPDGSEVALPAIPYHADDVALSFDGERAAWREPGVNGGIVIAAHDGSAPRTILSGDGVLREDAAWSPDGTRVAYGMRCPQPDGGYRRCGLGIADVAAGTERRIATTEPLGGARPTFAPDGDTLAFTGTVAAVPGCDGPECETTTDIHVVRADGGGLRRLTRGGHGSDDPAWSPDGRRIAYTRLDTRGEATGADDFEIYTVDPDGTHVENLTDDPDCDFNAGGCTLDDDDRSPAWSPDGRRIAFVSTRGEPSGAGQLPRTSQVWTMRPDGSGRARITASPRYKGNGTLSWRSLAYLETQAPPVCRDLAVRTIPGAAVDVALDCSAPTPIRCS